MQLCDCPRDQLVRLPIMDTDYYKFEGQLCACTRIQCRKCGHIQLESHYAVAHGLVSRQCVMDGPFVVPFRLTDEIRSLIAKREVEREALRQRKYYHKRKGDTAAAEEAAAARVALGAVV